MTTRVNFGVLHPFSTPSKNGYRLCLTIVDDYSRYTWIYLMKQKSETFHMLVHFFNQINRQFKTKVSRINSSNRNIFLPKLQTVRLDNGTEFISKQIQTWFHEHGIIHQRSCIATPQQNSIVEHKHRHLLD